MNQLSLSIAIPRSQEDTWKAITHWSNQSNWMLQTKVWVTSEISEGVGTKIAAITGPFNKAYPRMKRFGLLDLMEVTLWQPPARCDVYHYGAIIKGGGSFRVEAVSRDRSIFHWSEEIAAPRLIFLLVKPFILIGVRISLARFRSQLE